MSDSGGRLFGRGVAWLGVGNLANAALQGGYLVIIAKLGSPEMVGQFALALAVSTPFIVLAQMRLEDLLATDASREYPFSSYLWLTVGSSVVSVGLISVVVVVLGYSSQTAYVIILLTLAKAIQSLSFVFHGLQRAEERLDLVGISSLCRGGLAFTGMAIGLYRFGSVAWGTFGILVGQLLTLGFYDIPRGLVAARVRAAANSSVRASPAAGCRRLLVLALPLGLSQMLIALVMSVPRFFLERFSGAAELGLFAGIAFLLRPGVVIMGIPGRAAAPRLAHAFAARQIREFQRGVAALSMFGLGLGLIAVCLGFLFGEFGLTVLFTPEYGRQVAVLTWVLLAGALMFAAMPLTQALIVTRQVREQLIIIIASVATATVAAITLIPAFGMLGAAWSLGLANAVRFVGSAWVVSVAVRSMGERPNEVSE